MNAEGPYTLEYVTDDETFTSTTPGLNLLALVNSLLYLAANEVLDYGDALYIFDHEDSHIYNFLEDINTYVEFQCSAGSYTFQATYEQALECLVANNNLTLMTITVRYRLTGTDTWETFTND